MVFYKSLLRYFTVGRLLNYFWLKTGYYLSRIFRQPFVWGHPFAISIEPTTVCNLKCPECPTGLSILQRSKGTLDLPNFKHIIDHLPKHTFYVNLFLQGEPTLNPQLAKMIEYASNRNLFTVVSTNAQLIDSTLATQLVKVKLSKLIVSMDGMTQKTYEIYRKNGSLEKVMQALTHIANEKKRLQLQEPIVIIQFIVFEHNQHELQLLDTLVKQKLADKIELKSAQIIVGDDIKPPENKNLSRYKVKDELIIQYKPALNHCSRIWETLVVSWDLATYPCCYDKDGDFPMGNLKSTSPLDVWKGYTFNKFRRTILANRSGKTMCTQCNEGRHWWD